MAIVGIVIGSRTDEPLVQPAIAILEQLGLSYELFVISAHRNPDKVREFGMSAEEKGFEVIIAAAGASAHLPGVIASWSTLPVIGVPLPTSEMKGIDSLYSIVQMPSGVPVACMGVGESGVKNAALLAGRLLGLKYSDVKTAYQNYVNKIVKA
jgi:5-(carboxyamino)imidazole ribonucleotide mutase